MININSLNITFATKTLFDDISVRANDGDRIGLAGVNGAGKSTLLKIIAGLKETDYGVVTRSKHTTTGYLPQEIAEVEPGTTLYEEAETSFADALKLQEELEEINHRLSSTDPQSPEVADLLHRQGELQHRLEQADIFTMKSKIEKVLLGLGFKESDFNKECSTFSGGWLMRLMLAKLLLFRPSFLLLDEPTNHLDIESLTWLEEFLQSYEGGLILITHDRIFLDNITSTTWELSLGKLTVYKGNYSKYVQEKKMRMEVTRAAYNNQQAKIDQTRRFVDRFRAKSTKAKQVQSKLKQLAKMDVIELDETENQINFRFPPAASSGKLALAVKGLKKSFDTPVFTDITFDMQRGDKMAVVGVNGAGKSTLVKILAGLIKPDGGSIQYGHNLKISYFGQHQAQELPGNYTVLETMNYVDDENKTMTQIRSLLGAFLFRGEDVDKKVQVLSGGEKSRLALARMIATPANLLIMDEPTNHLDMASQEILQEAMAQYDGSIIVVSHNRYFIDSFTNKVLEIKDGAATLYDGNISYYLEKLRAERECAQQSTHSGTDTTERQQKSRSKEVRRLQAELRQEKSKKLSPLKKEAQTAEQELEELEARKEELEQILADPELYKDQELFADKSQQYSVLQRKLERIYSKWEDALAGIETIEAEFDRQIEQAGN